MLATASADATLRLWTMPDGLMTESSDQSAAVLKGHSKKVMLLKWHPSAEFTLASAGQSGGVRVWDIQMEKCNYNF